MLLVKCILNKKLINSYRSVVYKFPYKFLIKKKKYRNYYTQTYQMDSVSNKYNIYKHDINSTKSLNLSTPIDVKKLLSFFLNYKKKKILYQFVYIQM